MLLGWLWFSACPEPQGKPPPLSSSPGRSLALPALPCLLHAQVHQPPADAMAAVPRYSWGFAVSWIKPPGFIEVVLWLLQSAESLIPLRPCGGNEIQSL